MKARILTALVGIPLVLAAVACANPIPLYALVVAAGLACAAEAQRLFGGGTKGLSGMALVALTVLALPAILYAWEPGLSFAHPEWLPAVALVLFALGLMASARASQGFRGPFPLWGSLWFSVPLAGLVVMQSRSPLNAWELSWTSPVLMVLLPVWAGDIAAMLGGMAFGRHPLAPNISPKKTWEGAISNLGASTLCGWAVGNMLQLEPWVGLASGVAVGIFGQLGDLFESALKRRAGMKDSGSILPGHGGVLDRIDALLASILPVWLILAFSGSL